MPIATVREPAVSKKKKKSTSIRMSDEADRMLRELEEETSLSRTDLITQSIRFYFQKETGRKKPREKPEEDA